MAELPCRIAPTFTSTRLHGLRSLGRADVLLRTMRREGRPPVHAYDTFETRRRKCSFIGLDTTMRLDSYIAFMNGRLNHARIPMP
jgi:hypothetical protein